MTITKTNKNSVVTLALEGWLDTQSAPELGAELETIGELTALVLDFDKLEYISSSGLRQVTSAYKMTKQNNIDFQIINVNNEVMSVFELTGLDKKFNIYTK